MDLGSMNAVVSAELEHIPSRPEPQNMLRLVYSSLRKNSLGKKAQTIQSKENVLRAAIEVVKQMNPTWDGAFDREFFRL